MSSIVKSFFCFIGVMLPSFVCTYAVASDQIIDVKTELQQLIDDHKVRAAVVMYVEGDSEVNGLEKLGEISDSKREVPDETSTVFEIGSITKVFTALLVQTLVDDDLLDWDDTISEVLPEIEFANDAVESVTLRELATHRSGLPRLPTNFTQTAIPGNPMDPYANYGSQDLLAFLESFEPTELKKEYAYSNFGFALLGYIAATTLDTNYAEAMSQKVFQPLEMNNSTAFDSIEHDTELAAGYSNTANMGLWTFNAHAGAGVIRSTARDMYKFIVANLRETDDAIHHAIRSIRELQYETDHALGWITETSRNDTTVFTHSGLTGGYASFLAIDPEAKSGWVILTASTESDRITSLGSSFYRDLASLKSIDIAPYLGVYSLGQNQYMTVSDYHGNLQLQVTTRQPFVLEHDADHRFTLQALNYSAVFELGKDGGATSLKWSEPGVSIDAKRVDDKYGVPIREEVSIDSELLTEYVGEYQLPFGMVAAVKQIEDRLFVQVTGQPEFRVFPKSPTRFFYKALDAEIEFKKDGKDGQGTVTGTVFHQGGEHFAPRIKDKE